MKKILIVTLTFLMCLGLLTGCDTLLITSPEGGEGSGGDKPVTALEEFQQKYEKISEARLIGQSVTVKSGSLLQYSREKTFEKAGSGYAVEVTEKRLNDLSAEEPYTVTQDSYPVHGKAAEFSLDLDELYLKNLVIDAEAFTLEAEVREGSAETMFGIAGTLPAPAHGMHLSMAADAVHLLSFKLTYVSGNSDVAIELTFTY